MPPPLLPFLFTKSWCRDLPTSAFWENYVFNLDYVIFRQSTTTKIKAELYLGPFSISVNCIVALYRCCSKEEGYTGFYFFFSPQFKKINYYLFFMCIGVSCIYVYMHVMHVCLHHVHAVPLEARRGCHIPQVGVIGSCKLP